jgi:hypothetical protein
MTGGATRVHLEKSGVAPFSFVFGPAIDVWVGPFSEVVLQDVSKKTVDHLREALGQVFRSAVSVRSERWSTTIAFRLPGAEPWLRPR